MKFRTLVYSFKQGLVNIWRNKMFSLASIATMTACIFLFGTFYALGMNFSSMVKGAEEGVAVAGISIKEVFHPSKVALDLRLFTGGFNDGKLAALNVSPLA